VNDWKIIPTIVITTVLIFGAGVFSGGMLVNYVKQNQPHAAGTTHPKSNPANSAIATNNTNAMPVHPPPQALNKEFLQRLDGELHLTKEQHDAIQKIIVDGQNQMRKVLQDSRLEMREVLTPEQREQFDALVKHPFHKPIFNNTNNPPGTPPTAEAPTQTPPSSP
jgi:uncharacterized membrane protein